MHRGLRSRGHSKEIPNPNSPHNRDCTSCYPNRGPSHPIPNRGLDRIRYRNHSRATSYNHTKGRTKDRNNPCPVYCSKNGLCGSRIRYRYTRRRRSRHNTLHPYNHPHSSHHRHTAHRPRCFRHNNNPGFGSLLPSRGRYYYRRHRGMPPAWRYYMHPI